MYFREKVAISAIARRNNLSRNTVRKWLQAPERDELRYTRPQGKTKLDPFMVALRQALEADAHRPKRERRTRLRLFAEIQRRVTPGVTRNIDLASIAEPAPVALLREPEDRRRRLRGRRLRGRRRVRLGWWQWRARRNKVLPHRAFARVSGVRNPEGSYD